MKIKVKDANNKEFVVDTEKVGTIVTDFSSDSLLVDNGIKGNVSDENKKPCKVQIVDSEGKAVDYLSLKDAIDKGEEQIPAAIDVLFEATHSGINLNYWNYHSDSMAKDANSFVNPYKKPLLKNHDSFSEPLGRVKDVYYSKSDLAENRDCINILYRVTDKDAIEKFLDGRYETVSISGQPGKITCGICGKEILKDGAFNFCGHYRGEVYDGQRAVWNATDISYKETSVVNDPADQYAQVKRITIVKPGDNNDSRNSDNDDLLNDIDSVINNSENIKDNNEDSKNNVKDNNEDSKNNVKDNNENPSNDNKDNTENVSDSNEELEKLKKELKSKEEEMVSKDAEIATLNEELNTVKSEKESLQTKLSDSNSKVTVLTEKISDNESKYIKLAKLYKNELVEKIVDYEILKGITSKDKVEDRTKELQDKSSISLSAIYSGFNIDKIQTSTIPKPIDNPGIVNPNDPHQVNQTNDEEENKTIENTDEENVQTYKNFIDSAVNSLVR